MTSAEIKQKVKKWGLYLCIFIIGITFERYGATDIASIWFEQETAIDLPWVDQPDNRWFSNWFK